VKSCELVKVQEVVLIWVVSMEENSWPYGAVTDLSSSAINLLAVECTELSERKVMILVRIIKSEQILSVVSVSTIEVEVVDLFELFSANEIIHIGIIQCEVV
jgi:hypothetical protein